ncbi:MAG TPA: tetratricopeptide repeat protein [Candidatus Sulfotelmatobacter sp.]|nr:tetratricopeptide repeat protein [Candidatus Sulfotelmatobacter sp.]
MTLPGFQKALESAKAANACGYAASAFELYKRILAQDPDKDASKYYATWNLLDIGRISNAEALFKAINKEAAPKPWLIENLAGRLHRVRGRFSEAEMHFRNARKLDPDSTVPIIFLADTLIQQEKFDEALTVLTDALNLRNESLDEVYFMLGRSARAVGDYRSAHEYLFKALEIDPNYREAKQLLDDVAFWLDAGSKAADSEQLETMVRLAKKANAAEYEASAFELYKRVLALDPQRDSAKYHVVLNLLDVGRISDAEAYFGAMNGDRAPNPWFLEYAAGRLCVGRARLDEAELHFRNARRLNSKSTTPPVFLADALIQQEKFDAAKTVLLEALNIEDSLDAVYYYLGQAARATEDYQSAREYFFKTLSIDPDYPEAKQNLEDVEFWLKFVENIGRF